MFGALEIQQESILPTSLYPVLSASGVDSRENCM
jgi:hypothetical protein